MRKIILGLTAAAAIAAPIAVAGSANAAVSSDPNCVPVKAVAAHTDTLYKYVPAGKVSDGPTQWATAPATTHKSWTVKGKPVDYVRDGNKTTTEFHAAIEGVTCQLSTTVTLPDTFEVAHDGGYFSTQVTKTFTNNTDTDQVVNVMYADQQDNNDVWVESGVFDNFYHEVVIPAGQSKTITFSVWYDHPDLTSGADVPDGLTFTYSVTQSFDWV